MITAAKHVASRPTGQYQDMPPPNEHADPTVVNKYGSAIEQWSFEVLGYMSGHRLRCPHVCPCKTRCTSRTTLGMHFCNRCKFVHNALPREITKPGADEPATSMRGDFNARHMDGQQKTYECLCWVQDPPLTKDDYGVVFPDCARRPDGTKLGDQFTMIAQMGHTAFSERDAEFGIQMQYGEIEADHFLVEENLPNLAQENVVSEEAQEEYFIKHHQLRLQSRHHSQPLSCLPSETYHQLCPLCSTQYRQ